MGARSKNYSCRSPRRSVRNNPFIFPTRSATRAACCVSDDRHHAMDRNTDLFLNNELATIGRFRYSSGRE